MKNAYVKHFSRSAHSLDAEVGGKVEVNEERNQPEPEIGGFDICAFGSEESRSIERITATFDSGAAVCVMPVEAAVKYSVKPTKASQEGATYRAAGGACVPYLGSRTWRAKTTAGLSALTCGAAEVSKVLLSVAKIGPRQPGAVRAAGGRLLHRGPEERAPDEGEQAQGCLRD